MKLKRKYLKTEEILKIDNFNHELSSFDNAAYVVKLKIEIMNLQIEKMHNEIQTIMQQKANKKSQAKTFNDELKKQCGIKQDKWGYDPDSGEIKL